MKIFFWKYFLTRIFLKILLKNESANMLEQAKLESQQSSAAGQHSEEVRRSAFCCLFLLFCFFGCWFLFFVSLLVCLLLYLYLFSLGNRCAASQHSEAVRRNAFRVFFVFILLVCMLLFVLVFSSWNCIIFACVLLFFAHQYSLGN